MDGNVVDSKPFRLVFESRTTLYLSTSGVKENPEEHQTEVSTGGALYMKL
jgi:hypothetical protein